MLSRARNQSESFSAALAHGIDGKVETKPATGKELTMLMNKRPRPDSNYNRKLVIGIRYKYETPVFKRQ